MTLDQPPHYGKPTVPPPPPPPAPPVVDPAQAALMYGATPVHQPQYYGSPHTQHRYAPDGVRLVSTGVRVAARLIDFVLLSIVSFVGGLISSAALGSDFDYNAYRATSAVIGVLVAVGSIAYFVLGESAFGTSVGKLIVGVRVRSASGAQLDFASAFKRNAFVLPMYLGSLVSSMILLGSGDDIVGALASVTYGGVASILGTIATIGLSIALIISISNSPNMQGYHDKLANADVVTTR